VFHQRFYYVYMMMSSSRRALYTGITSRPRQRVWEHKTGAIEGFSKQYHTTRLVYLEAYRYVATAIAREKQIKRWRREKKLALIESMNPQYRDLAADWFEPQGASTRADALGRDDND
jgi:putative endonuclease